MTVDHPTKRPTDQMTKGPIMPQRAKRVFKKIVSYSGIVFFAVAVGMLWWQLRNYSGSEIINAILDIPPMNLALAAIACILGYAALAVYDRLALSYVRQAKKVKWWKWMLAGMLGFAISNNAGHAVVSGGAIRYRLYTRWRIRAGDIVKMLTFSGFTYFLGATSVAVLGFLAIPRDLLAQSTGAAIGFGALFLFCVGSLGAYFAMTLLFRGKKIRIGEIEFRIPSWWMATKQTILGATDSIFAGLVLYAVLTPFVQIPFLTFIGIFVIAQTTGIFSQVPGGIGVFESVFMIALPDGTDRAAVFGALLAFRIIYYVLPLAATGALFFLYEFNLRAKMKRWLEEAKAATAAAATKTAERVRATTEKIRTATQKLPKLPKRKK
jgi:phosphatidylglycerol lysyltransferase